MNAAPFLSENWYRVAGLRPRLAEHVEVRHHAYRGCAWYVIHDPLSGNSFRLSRASAHMLGDMDGARPVDELWRRTSATCGEDAPSQDETIRYLTQLQSAGLLHFDGTFDASGLLEQSARIERSKWVRNVLNPFSIRIPLLDPERWLDRTIPAFRWAFGPVGLALWFALVAPAVVLAAEHWQELTENLSDRILAADNLVLMSATYFILKAMHEFGHGYAVKGYGGTVREMGVMFLVFFPIPYVDASAATKFRLSGQRVVVGAAGMLVELLVAALAMYAWLALEPGLSRAIAFNIMTIAGVSTLVFNANPLLRYDGYYILADLLEIPNLAARGPRYLQHLVDKHVLGLRRAEAFQAAAGERFWFLIYTPSSYVYRQLVMLGIALFVATQYAAVGIALALWTIVTAVVLPLVKAWRYVVTHVELRHGRAKALTSALGGVALVLGALFLLPVPFWTHAEGVVWLPEDGIVRAGADGFIEQLLVPSDRKVESGVPLIRSGEPALARQIEALHARVQGLETRLAAERFVDRAQAELTATELRAASGELANRSAQLDRLLVRSRIAGLFAVPRPDDLPGRFVREGEAIGYILPDGGGRIVRATVRQEDADLVRLRLRGVAVRLTDRVEDVLPARLVRELPSGRDELPSRALGNSGGGAVTIDPRDPRGVKSLQRTFQFDLALPPDAPAPFGYGTHVFIRFEHGWEPLGFQIWRRGRQLLLSRIQA
jgi:putative peptide zinc metalloprotease protein